MGAAEKRETKADELAGLVAEVRAQAALDVAGADNKLCEMHNRLELLEWALKGRIRDELECEAFTMPHGTFNVLVRACNQPGDAPTPAREQLRQFIAETAEFAELLDDMADDELDQDAPAIISAAVGFVFAQRRCLDARRGAKTKPDADTAAE